MGYEKILTETTNREKLRMRRVNLNERFTYRGEGG
jgi:hypothetical protein